jgi:Type II secretion system (T2SS), protein E, N-terminal domain
MRLQLSTAAEALEDESYSLPEFGTGLRARLDVVRSLEVAPLPARKSDVSPELMLVSPEPAGMDGILGELLAQRVPEARREPLGALLAEAGLLSEAEIELALRTARNQGKRLGEILTELGLVAPADVVRMVADQRGLPFLDIASLSVDPSAARLLPADRARSLRTLPIGFVRGLPVVALADPSDEEAIDGTRTMLRAAEFVASPEESILAQLARLSVRAV